MCLIVILTRPWPCSLHETKQKNTIKSKVFFNNISCPKSRNFLSHPKIRPSKPSCHPVQHSDEVNRLFARTIQGDTQHVPVYLGYSRFFVHRSQNL